ncbi:MAG: efflux RND transporter periplasmic adaptor subunit [Candidatus Thiodiazotropha taylori]|nr:efflux RND transporter periplasmic adaptor subunit [Candidatus Thiodiazotropha taylori]
MRVLMLICLLYSGQSLALDLEAVTSWYQQVELSTTVDGMVSRVNAGEGEKVSRGTILIELDQRAYTSRLAAAESRLEAATQQNAEAKRELDRSLELYDRTLLSDHERKQAEIEAAESDAAYREADAQLAKVRLDIDYSRITAPFDGIVEEVYVQPGQAVINRQQAQPLLNLCHTGRMKVTTDVTAQQADKLKPGIGVQIGLRGQWLNGEISRVGLKPVAEDANGARYLLEATFQPPEAAVVRAGEKAVLRIADE